MATLKITLDLETIRALDERAKVNLRWPEQEAVALLRQGLGLTFPYDVETIRKHAEQYAEEQNRKMKTLEKL